MEDVRSIWPDSRAKVTERQWAAALLAERQGGVVALWQLLGIGVSRSTVKRWIAGGRLHPIHAGVYALGHRAIGWKGRLAGGVIACGPDAVLGFRSAAAWSEVLPSERATVDVIAPGRHRRRGIQAHVMILDPRECTEREGIRITTVARTLLDLAEVVPQRRLAKALENAERLRLFDLAAVHDVLQKNPGRHGQRPLRALLSQYTPVPLTRSELEEAFWELLKVEGLPLPATNALAAGIYEVDALWERQRLVVELDSWEYHGARAAFERDRDRDIELRLAGYTPIRVTAWRLTRDRERLVRQLTALLGRP
jgi:very-short-patch-repair endonuclease/predicted transcriptional regulator of viral defense system